MLPVPLVVGWAVESPAQPPASQNPARIDQSEEPQGVESFTLTAQLLVVFTNPPFETARPRVPRQRWPRSGSC
jgi:hypothetical protein